MLVPAKITLTKLHDLLQLVMGWTNSHLHGFQVGKKSFAMAGANLEELDMLDEKKYTLEGVLGDSIREFVYEYDFGDSWGHRIKVSSVAQPKTDGSIHCALPGNVPDDVVA
jgi:hypothetical protein